MFSRSWRAACCAALIAGAGFVAAQGPVLDGPPAGPVIDAPAPRPAAAVNGVAITMAEVEGQMKSCPSAQPDAPRRVRQMEALGLLIDSVLMRQFLDREVGPAKAEDVTRRLAELEAGLQKEMKSLAEFCQETGQTMEQLRSALADH